MIAFAALLRNHLDRDPVAVDLADLAGDDDLLLGDAHAAELHEQSLERARVAAGEGSAAARDERHRMSMWIGLKSPEAPA
jgi:hypothetical protein